MHNDATLSLVLTAPTQRGMARLSYLGGLVTVTHPSTNPAQRRLTSLTLIDS